MNNSQICEQLVVVMLSLSIDKLKEKKKEIIEYAQENDASAELIGFFDWAFDRATEIKIEEQKERQRIADELEIIGHHPLVGFNGTYMGKFFQTIIDKSAEDGFSFADNPHFMMSQAYTYGLISGKRRERAKRRRTSGINYREKILELLDRASEKQLRYVYIFLKEYLSDAAHDGKESRT